VSGPVAIATGGSNKTEAFLLYWIRWLDVWSFCETNGKVSHQNLGAFAKYM